MYPSSAPSNSNLLLSGEENEPKRTLSYDEAESVDDYNFALIEARFPHE